jgi:hypothetical protein
MNSDIFVSVLYVLLAGGLASATSFPPRLPPYVIGWYDYPIIRVILLTLISGIGIYVPEIALLLAIGYGIIGEDIIKTASNKKEGFESSKDAKSPELDLEHIQLLPGPSDVEESKNLVSKRTASLDGIQNTLRSLQLQIQSMVSK